MGTPDFAAATLRAVAEAGHEIAAIYTQPPRPAGRRGLEHKPSPVHTLGAELGIEVRTPKSLRGEAEQQAFAALNADAAVVVAYGLLLPEPVLEGTRLGAFNGHASLLPRWRGAAPIQRAIMAGDTETGIMIMKMDEGLDTGPVALTHCVPIDPDLTAGELHDELARSGAALMVEALALLEAGKLTLIPQPPEGATYAHKIAKDETRVDWSRPADEVHNHIRGLSPFPGAWCEMENAGRVERVKLLRSTVDTLPPPGSNGAYTEPGTVLDDELAIACGAGAVRLVELQRAGGKPLSAEDFQRGAKLAPGVVVR